MSAVWCAEWGVQALGNFLVEMSYLPPEIFALVRALLSTGAALFILQPVSEKNSSIIRIVMLPCAAEIVCTISSVSML